VLQGWAAQCERAEEEASDGEGGCHSSSCAQMQQLYQLLGRELSLRRGQLAEQVSGAFASQRLVWLPDEQQQDQQQQQQQQQRGSFYSCGQLRYRDPAGLLPQLPPGVGEVRVLETCYPALQHFFCHQLKAGGGDSSPLVAPEPDDDDYCASLLAVSEADCLSRQEVVRLAGVVLGRWAAAYAAGGLQQVQVAQLAAAVAEARVLPVSNTGEGLASLADSPLLVDDPQLGAQVTALPGVLLLQVGPACARGLRLAALGGRLHRASACPPAATQRCLLGRRHPQC
jgi:hypothetical protein